MCHPYNPSRARVMSRSAREYNARCGGREGRGIGEKGLRGTMRRRRGSRGKSACRRTKGASKMREGEKNGLIKNKGGWSVCICIHTESRGSSKEYSGIEGTRDFKSPRVLPARPKKEFPRAQLTPWSSIHRGITALRSRPLFP